MIDVRARDADRAVGRLLLGDLERMLRAGRVGFSNFRDGPTRLPSIVGLSSRSFARVPLPHLLDLFQDLNEVVGRRVLQRRELNAGLEFLQPQLLANGQHVRIIQRKTDGTATMDFAPHQNRCSGSLR